MAVLILPDKLEHRQKYNALAIRFFELFFSYFIN
jgi:hypothetical protein